MRYELNLYLRIIYGDLRPSINHGSEWYRKHLEKHYSSYIEKENFKDEEAKFYYYKFLLSSETKSIKNNLHEVAYSLGSRKKISVYIGNHQQALKYFAQQINERLAREGEEEMSTNFSQYPDAAIYLLFYQNIRTLYVYLENSFSEYIDFSIHSPFQNRDHLSPQQKIHIITIYEILNQRVVDNELLKIIKGPLEQCMNDRNDWPSKTYLDRLYLKKLIERLYEQLNNRGEGADLDKLLLEVLYELNFNSIAFLNYIISNIQKELEEHENEQLPILYRYLKIYNQLQLINDHTYRQDVPPIKNHVINWLKEEIDFLNKSKELKATEEAVIVPTTKVTINMSVAELAYFLKVMMELQIITTDKPSILFKIVCNNFITEKTKSISEKSIKNKYYNIEDSTKQALIETIQKMSRHIKKSH